MQTKTYKGHPITLSKNPSPSSTWNSEAPLPNSQVKKVINGVVSTLPPIHLDLTINSQFLCHIATQQGEKEEREICSLHFPKILFVPRQVFHHSFSLLHLICLGTRNQGGKLKENVWKVLENYILSFFFSFFFRFLDFLVFPSCAPRSKWTLNFLKPYIWDFCLECHSFCSLFWLLSKGFYLIYLVFCELVDGSAFLGWIVELSFFFVDLVWLDGFFLFVHGRIWIYYDIFDLACRWIHVENEILMYFMKIVKNAKSQEQIACMCVNISKNRGWLLTASIWGRQIG